MKRQTNASPPVFGSVLRWFRRGGGIASVGIAVAIVWYGFAVSAAYRADLTTADAGLRATLTQVGRELRGRIVGGVRDRAQRVATESQLEEEKREQLLDVDFLVLVEFHIGGRGPGVIDGPYSRRRWSLEVWAIEPDAIMRRWPPTYTKAVAQVIVTAEQSWRNVGAKAPGRLTIETGPEVAPLSELGARRVAEGLRRDGYTVSWE